MRKIVYWLLVVVFLGTIALGCGGDKDKGINKDKDRPKTEDKGK